MKRRLESPEEAGARLQAHALTPGERALLWDRIQSTCDGFRPRRLRAVAFGVGGVAALAAAAVVIALLIPRWLEKPVSVLEGCQLDPVGKTLELPASCEASPVRVGEDEWVLMPAAKVSRVEGGARVEAGRVEFRVHRRERTDFRVYVSAGHQVRVIGTVFKIEQEGASGSVSVTEGVIEFTWSDGARERVAAGQTLFWPRRAASSSPAASAHEPRIEGTRSKVTPPGSNAAGTSASAVKAPSAAASASNLESVMDRVLLLKSQRRFGELIALLERTLHARDISPVQRQRLSYELGLAREAAGQSACDHWQRHAKSYGAGRPGGALANKLERCKK